MTKDPYIKEEESMNKVRRTDTLENRRKVDSYETTAKTP